MKYSGEIKYLIHNQMSEYDCMYSIISEIELANVEMHNIEPTNLTKR